MLFVTTDDLRNHSPNDRCFNPSAWRNYSMELLKRITSA